MKEFFTSYASLDAQYSDYLHKFVEDLAINVRDRTTLTLDKVAFFAKDDITTGEIWVEVLGEAVRTCKVILCICSPSYYNSEYCGKELGVFLERRKEWVKQTAPGDQAPFILPVLWVNKKQGVPKVFKDLLQSYDGPFPKDYKELGLKKLIELKGRADGSDYKQVLVRLGDLIEEAIDKQPRLPAHPEPIVFGALNNAFQEPRLRGAASLVVSGNPADWRPFAAGPGVLTMLESVFSGLGIGARDITARVTAASLAAFLDEAEQYSEVVIVAVNPLSYDAGLLAALNAKPRANVAVIVLWPDAVVAGAEADRVNLETNLRQQLNVVAADPSGPHDFSASRSSDEFRRSAQASFAKVRAALVANSTPQRKAEDPATVAAAQQGGVPVMALPILTAGGDAK